MPERKTWRRMPEQLTIAKDNEVIRRISLSLDESDYLVGGSVRDLLLGKNPVDYDILTFGNVWDKAVSLGITPDLYSRFISLVPERKNGPAILREILANDWKFEFSEMELRDIQLLLGLSS